MERILVQFNKSGYDSYMNGLRNAISDTNNIASQVNQINSYQMTKDALTNLMSGNGEVAAMGIRKASEADIEKAGIRSKSVRDLAIKGDQEAYYSIINKYQSKSEYTEGITIIDGRVCQKEGFDEILRERHSSYVETEKGKAIYEAQQKVVELINEILALSTRMDSQQVSLLYKMGYGEKKVYVNELNYDAM